MVLEGRIENGLIVFDGTTLLPEGARVRVEVLNTPTPSPVQSTLYERLKSFDGVLDDLPDDSALNHDHYLYGSPKKP